MANEEILILKKALEREKLARKEAEKILEEKSLELYEKNQELSSINQNLSSVIKEKTSELNDIFDNITDSYILMDLHGNVLKMNKPAIDFFGYDSQKEKFNVTEIIYQEDGEYAYESFYKLIEDGSFKNYQARIYTKSREVKWVQINSSIIKNASGEPIFAHGIVRDVTNDRLIQEKFELQKQQLDAIVDNSSLGIVLVEGEKIVKTNKAFQNLIEYSEEELYGLSVSSISDTEYKSESESLINDLNKGRVSNFSINKKYQTKSGSLVWAKTNVAAVKDNVGKIKYQVALVEDITEDLKKGAMLEALNNLMSSILGKTDIYEIAWEITKNTIGLIGFEDCVIYLLDNDKKELNQIAAYGEKVNESDEILNKISIPLGKGIVGEVALTGRAEIIDDTTKDKRYITDDKVRYSEIAVPIIANGEIIGVIDSEHTSKNFFSDDHLKTLQTIASLAATQLKSALNLQQKLKTEKENQQLLKDLMKSNNELNDFAHIVSHDLKSPLRSMNALLNWMKDDLAEVLTEENDNNLELLIKKVDKMDQLINGILDYASIDNVKNSSNKIDLNLLLEDIVETIFIPENIEVNIQNSLPTITGDKFRLQQLFQNLLSNAIKYSDKKKGKVGLRFSDLNHSWKFEVYDNGIGIEERYFKKIFQIFQVLEEKENSTGVGLSIVKKIIDFYNGKIWVESKKDIGTTFYFTLPK